MSRIGSKMKEDAQELWACDDGNTWCSRRSWVYKGAHLGGQSGNSEGNTYGEKMKNLMIVSGVAGFVFFPAPGGGLQGKKKKRAKKKKKKYSGAGKDTAKEKKTEAGGVD